MIQTLFYIPDHIGKFPMFGVTGLASIAWALICVALLAWLSKRPGYKRDDAQGYLFVMSLVWVVLAFVAPIISEEGYGIPVRGYGVLMLIGVIAGVALAVYRARQMYVDPELIFSLAFVLFVTAIVGARFFYVLQYWKEQFQDDSLLVMIRNIANVTQGGLVVYGSLIGGLAGGIWFAHRHKLPVLAIGDLIAPSLLVGLAIGRIGCLMNGCCFGGICEQPWAITFPFNSPPYQDQMQDEQVPGLGIFLEHPLTVFRRYDLDENGVLDAEEIEAVGRGEFFATWDANADESISRDELMESYPVIVSSVDRDGLAAGKIVSGIAVEEIDGRTPHDYAHAMSILSHPRSTLEIRQANRDAVVIQLPRSKPIQPTQIYSAINATLLAALLWVAYPFRQRDGVIIALLLTLYPISRFLLEAIRTDEPGRFGTGMTISQLVSLGIAALAIGLWIYIFQRPAALVLPGKKPLTLSTPAKS